MVQQLMRASSSRTLLRACLNSHASTSTAFASRAYSSSSSMRLSSLARSRMHGGLAFPALSHRQTRSTSGQLNQRRSISLWSDGNSPAPIIGSDGKLQTAASSTGATASTTPSTSASQAVTPTAASEELGIDFQSAGSTAPISSTTPPHTFSLETIPTELSESINETRRTLQEYGLGGSTPSGWVQSLLEWVHLTTGLPWYATIGLTVITVRMMLLPIMVGGISNNARLARIQPQLMANIASIKKAQQDGNTLQVHKLQLATRQLFEDNKCGPLRGLMLPLIQMPLFISFFFALRGMAAAGLPDFTTGGVAWFTNLSIPDPYYVLPVVSAAATLAVLQVGEYGAPPKQGAMKGVMGAFKLATPAIAYVASGFPSAVLVYWVTHNSFSVLQAFLLKIPAFKRWADIPDPPPQDKKNAGVGFMQAFRDTKEAFGDLKEGAVERTDRKFAEGQQEKALDKQVEERAARKKATLEKLKASGSAVDDAEMSAADEKQARLAAARKRRESHRNRRTRI